MPIVVIQPDTEASVLLATLLTFPPLLHALGVGRSRLRDRHQIAS